MSQVLLVRHGQASWGSADHDVLSDLGERQSRMLGEALAARGVVPDLVVRGAMRRHRQTAEQAVAGAGWAADVVVDDGWNEFDHVQMLAMHPPGSEGEELTREQFQAWFEEARCAGPVAPTTRTTTSRSPPSARGSTPRCAVPSSGSSPSRPRWCSPPAGRCPGSRRRCSPGAPTCGPS